MKRDGSLRAEIPERHEESFCNSFVMDPDNLVFDLSRVCHRTENIEYGLDAKVGPRFGRMLHCRMIERSEEKADPNGVEALSRLHRRALDVHPQRHQHIGASASTGDGTVAMLCDGDTCPCDDKCRCR